MHLYDLLDSGQLAELTSGGYVREQDHPTEPLAIITYSDKAQIEGQTFWEDYPTLWHCRGLIYNTDNGEIVARPFKKFWNYGQGAAPKLALDERVYTTDKVDGSLGILYREPLGGNLAIATRGSFTSKQAIHATDVLHNWYGMDLATRTHDPREGWHVANDETFLFEIVYPENRIVVNYHRIDDLFLLGSVDLDDGTVYRPAVAAIHLDWNGPRAESLGYNTLGEALAAPPRENREGIVVSTMYGGPQLKIKQEDYVVLHRIVTGLSERRVWQALMAGQTVDQINEPLPDEFHPWVEKVALKLVTEFNRRQSRMLDEYYNAMATARQAGWASRDEDGYHDVTDRKSIALLFQESDQPWALFALLDGRDIQEKLWKQLEPVGDVRPNGGVESE